MTIAEIATTGMVQVRRSRNDIKTILRASAIPSFNVIARSGFSQSALTLPSPIGRGFQTPFSLWEKGWG